jgi:subfamily B ATP-binding cassette protein HlyB/CyaB
MFMLFHRSMSWLRQYLVLHTGNRIDAVLGSQVFRHLLRLPLPYFEHRPTGTWSPACTGSRPSASSSPARPSP